MCVNCNTGSIADILEESRRQNQTDEEWFAEQNEQVARLRDSVIQTIPMTDNVKLHLTDTIPQVAISNLKRWIRHMEKIQPAPGKVDIFAPYINTPDAAGATIRIDENGYLSEEAAFRMGNGDRLLYLASRVFQDMDLTMGELLMENSFMPAGVNASKLFYVFMHEWGHVIDTRGRDEFSMESREMRLVRELRVDHPFSNFNRSMSYYGLTGELEAYAEAFAEWNISEGKTNNFAARWYAKEYNWFPYNNK